MACFWLSCLDMHQPMRSADTLLAGKHEECLRTRVRMHWRDAARRTAGFVDAKQILRLPNLGDWPNIRNFDPAFVKATRPTESEEPDFARRFSRQRPMTGC